MSEQLNRRKEDSFDWKLQRLAGIIIAIGVLFGAVYTVIGLKFETRLEADIVHADIQKQVTAQDKTLAVMNNKLDNIQTMLKEIKEAK